MKDFFLRCKGDSVSILNWPNYYSHVSYYLSTTVVGLVSNLPRNSSLPRPSRLF